MLMVLCRLPGGCTVFVRVDEGDDIGHLYLCFSLKKSSDGQTMSNTMRIFLSSNSSGIIE